MGGDLRVAVRHRIGDFRLDVAFRCAAPQILVLFGPSGAGKSTLLEAVAGLIRAEQAEVWLGEEALHALPPERRGIGMVFQDGRLFPHLSVQRNLEYGLRRSSRSGMGLAEIVGLLGLEGMLGRRPGSLSGGERQRVALGRALLAHPRLLLMDEPLASLDQARRMEILPYLRRVAEVARVPVLYVTHARDEVVRLADSVALIERGRLAGFGPLPELASQPGLDWARSDEAGGVLNGRVAGHEPARGLTRVGLGRSELLVPLMAASVGQPVRLFMPAREVMLATARPEAVSVNNVLPARVTALVAEAERHAVLIGLAIDGGHLLSRVTQDAVARLGVRVGGPVFALVKSMSLEVLG